MKCEKCGKQLTDPREVSRGVCKACLDVMFFESPSEAADRVELGANARNRQAQREEDFWRGLYDRNKDLKGNEIVVKAVALHNASSLSRITDPNEMEKEIAGLARRELQRIKGKHSSHDESEPGRPQRPRGLTSDDRDREVMVGGPEHGSPWVESEPERGWSLGDTIRERRAARHEHEMNRLKPGRKVPD